MPSESLSLETAYRTGRHWVYQQLELLSTPTAIGKTNKHHPFSAFHRKLIAFTEEGSQE
jgi:hypothetical protein